MDIGDIKKYLEEKGISPSFQRIKILEYLLTHKNHPTVDTIYKELMQLIPTLSKTTVYNTLKSFFEKGIVTVITIEEGEARYDADVSVHGHFKCNKCGEVIDFDAEVKNGYEEFLKGSIIDEKHIYFRGTCKKCAEKS
jgi:Fur family peroxide stress response transcriptional regulator